MDENQKNFLKQQFIPLLRNADPTTPARWGKMSFQHMVEHMVLTFKSANGKIKTGQVYTPAEKIDAFQDFIRSEKMFRENTRSPAFPEEPLPLHFASSEAGIDKLETEVADFFKVYDATPGLKITNPVFGDLDYEHAVRLVYKHAKHHLRQFGLVSE